MADQYPFDPTMSLASNKIVREQHVITPTNFRDYHYVIPKFAPFFIESATIALRLPSGAAREMIEGRDYYFSHQFLDASATTNHTVGGSISFLDTDTEGVLEISYHTIGGKWTLTPAKILEILANNTRNPRITSWEFVANPPERFPVVDHPHDIIDFKTMADVQKSVDGIRDAILSTSGGGLASHVANQQNPHGVTKAQVGLSAVLNYGIATQAEATAGTSNVKYMTPLRVAEAIAAKVTTAVNVHATRTDNPHGTTAAQVGLGNVMDYSMASKAEAEAGAVDTRYMSPLRVKEAITAQVGNTLTAFMARTDNPHGVTAAQVGLFNVGNYAVATAEEARAGERNDRYMTPLRTNQLVQQYVFGSIGSHVSDTNNPHGVTKAQVGLGSVQNYGIATAAEMTAGTATNKYVTPALVAAVLNPVKSSLEQHLTLQDNPHGVTAAQVGAYSTSEMDYALSQRLMLNGKAADSTLFDGLTRQAFAEWIMNSSFSQDLADTILEEAGNNFVGRIDTPMGTGKWVEIHSVPTGTNGGGTIEEKRDGYAYIIGASTGAANNFSSIFTLRTVYRGTGDMKVEAASSYGVDTNIKFGFVRDIAVGRIRSYVFVPNGAAGIRVMEMGNYEVLTVVEGSATTPTGLVAVNPISVWADTASLATRMQNAEQAIAAINTILSGVSVV